MTGICIHTVRLGSGHRAESNSAICFLVPVLCNNNYSADHENEGLHPWLPNTRPQGGQQHRRIRLCANRGIHWGSEATTPDCDWLAQDAFSDWALAIPWIGMT